MERFSLQSRGNEQKGRRYLRCKKNFLRNCHLHQGKRRLAVDGTGSQVTCSFDFQGGNVDRVGTHSFRIVTKSPARREDSEPNHLSEVL